MAAGVLGNCALPPGEMVGRASAIDREERRALIGGIIDPHTDSEIHLVGTPARTRPGDCAPLVARPGFHRP